MNPHPMLQKAFILMQQKSEDYNGTANADPARIEYFPFGHQSYLHMLHTKLERIKSVVLNPRQTPNFESASDSILDLINYAAFYGSYLEQEEARLKKEQAAQLKQAEQQIAQAKEVLGEDNSTAGE